LGISIWEAGLGALEVAAAGAHNVMMVGQPELPLV